MLPRFLFLLLLSAKDRGYVALDTSPQAHFLELGPRNADIYLLSVFHLLYHPELRTMPADPRISEAYFRSGDPGSVLGAESHLERSRYLAFDFGCPPKRLALPMSR